MIEHHEKTAKYALLGSLVCIPLISLTTYLAGEGSKLVGFPAYAMVLCWYVAAFQYAKAKGRSGILGIFLLCFNVIGLIILVSLEDQSENSRTRRRR